MTRALAELDLPDSLLDVAETLGIGVVARLMQEFGGMELKFPKNPGPDHPVILALGENDGRALCHHLSGSAIYVPHGRAGQIRRQVEALSKAGKGRGEIARALGISQRHVRRVAATGDRDDRQGDLFPED